MDIKEQISNVIESVNKDGKLLEKFKAAPIDTVRELVGALPDDVVEKIVAGVKAKLTADKLSDVAGSLGKLFKKD